MSTMSLEDYIARIGYKEEGEVFHGRISNIRDVVNFYGATHAELKQEFRNSLDCYLEVCDERGLAPAPKGKASADLHAWISDGGQ